MTPPRPSPPDPGHLHNEATAHGNHAIAAGNIRNVFIRWALQHPSARWLPLLLACAALIIAGTTWPDGPASQYALWGALITVSLATAAGRVLVQRPADARIVAALSLVSVLTTVGGYLAFRNVVTHGEVDVTGKVTTRGGQPLDATTHRSITLSLDAPALRESRNALRLTLAVDDHDPAGPTCVPDSYVTASLLTSGVPTQAQRVNPGGTADFSLGAQASTVQIDVTLTTGRGCRMAVRPTRATLYDQ
ncbi:hypothetical protein ACFU90_24190 [Streptomyces noursei]|uniref:Uncharacterized protein n=1 Tax=Streptomyces noursei TaxID=1971 RepID=A0A059WBQ6_STRNR|nr:hypothetical protein [Streptomyces noursei]AKA08836.1 hypothetical protein SAZ_25685 [Streptomyces noursei ZPM]AIA05272.1 hypothetical protein DC74_4798 [Streptomyces noursei]EOT03369.1 hypothetical protein K530_13976 [Streptomyces noursei CCRC 11814]EXU85276.1 hypothetical protein P354_11915 [Streptomyces noursei PD-1]MCZ0971187.1 hypothetical protein [Streptomyces noursei]